MPESSNVVLITGASSGMGAATAVRLARDGARVMLAARRRERLEQVAEQVRRAGGQARVCVTDVAVLADVQNLVHQTLEAFGRLDVVFNNAGLMRVAPIEKLSHQDIEQMIRVNFLGAAWVLKETVPILKQQNSGLIINVSSVLGGRKTRATAWIYAGTKWAVTAMNEGLREELVGTRVRVCALQPGVVDTELFETFEVHPRQYANISTPIQPGEVAELIAFIVRQPWHFNINEVMFRPTEQTI
ncbi:MAG: SDR family oxidoreductase [Phycisphaerae bacterium]|jgi:NADP-dependent 3-hydroxy acid dehydrogenase YdfG